MERYLTDAQKRMVAFQFANAIARGCPYHRQGLNMALSDSEKVFHRNLPGEDSAVFTSSDFITLHALAEELVDFFHNNLLVKFNWLEDFGGVS